MAKSERETCPCGQAHVVGLFHIPREDWDEWKVPDEVHAFGTCSDLMEWIDTKSDDNTWVIDGMSTHVRHFPDWLSAYKLRHMPLDEIDPADPEFLKKLRGENDS